MGLYIRIFFWKTVENQRDLNLAPIYSALLFVFDSVLIQKLHFSLACYFCNLNKNGRMLVSQIKLYLLESTKELSLENWSRTQWIITSGPSPERAFCSLPRPIPTAGVGSLVQLCKPAHVEFVMPQEITSTEGEGVEAWFLYSRACVDPWGHWWGHDIFGYDH